MSRPHIIRADTLDLQDKTTPSAQDHTRQPEHPAPLGIGPAAPHQAAAVRHVAEEQSVEQERLSEAWNNAGTLHEEPESDDELTTLNGANELQHYGQDEPALRQNGGQSGSAEDPDLHEGEGDDGTEDDMMEKLSSSPSIDDGGYSLPSSPWPKRKSSLTPILPATPPREGVKGGGRFLSSVDIQSSSPFTSPPDHFPLIYTTSVDNTVAHCASVRGCTSHLNLPPPFFPSLGVDSNSPSLSKDHHLNGEYIPRATDQPTGSDQQHNIDSLPRGSSLTDANYTRIDNTAENNGTSTIRHIESDDEGSDSSSEFLTCASLISHIEGVPPSPSDSSSTWISESIRSFDEDDYIDDDQDDVSFPSDERFIDSGWGGECLRDSEDIDFEFVYALHTFVATVEGQANATKGDTMVLLDDSNSYWWLVRVVKDSSIGYLPAEHIETPTERLARLNKHRNIDLSATMLGDNPEKSKNPLKKAMRRRNAKTVQFTAPTYHEPSDYDYSSDEEQEEMEQVMNGHQSAQVNEVQDAQEARDTDADATVEPLKVNRVKKDSNADITERTSTDSSVQEGNGEADRSTWSSEEIFDQRQRKSKNGTVRNTDSFFKDDNVETRKITLTPNLLRDDSISSGSTIRSVDSKERGPSFDTLEKTSSPPDKGKDDKKKKEKKPGMLSGLFKRKEKKGKAQEDELAELEKSLTDAQRGSPTKVTEDSSPVERSGPLGPSQAPQRHTSKGKLQKAPPGESAAKLQQEELVPEPLHVTPSQPQPLSQPNNALLSGPAATSTMRLVSPEGGRPDRPAIDTAAAIRTVSPEPQSASGKPDHSRKMSPITNILRSGSGSRTEKVRKVKQRMELDDFDSSPENENMSNPFSDPVAEEETKDTQPQQALPLASRPEADRLSESPVVITSEDTASQPPGLVNDSSSQEDRSPSPVSSASTPSLIEAPDTSNIDSSSILTANTTPSSIKSTKQATVLHPTEPPPEPSRPAPRSPATQSIQWSSSSSSTITPPPHSVTPTPAQTQLTPPPEPVSTPQEPLWSDASLRHYLDSSSAADVRDLLIIVHDNSGVVPVSADHPMMAGLFVEERGKLKEMEKGLDALLGDWLKKKQARAAKKGLGTQGVKAVEGGL